ncbi:MAG: tetratricopeptide repeat protein [Pseudomonadales bacterium]|jgi:tetratricopeptide (TPR) repeat protein|nr:tetratricopeptide repeat protein [Pseudomonadales bacterium]
MSRLPPRQRRALCALLLVGAAGTCLSVPLWAQNRQPQSPPPLDDAAVVYGQIPEDLLTRTIEAEFAAQNGRLRQALTIYADLAKTTNNLSIIQRAMRIAASVRDIATTLDMGGRWLALDPGAVEPRQNMALELLLVARYGDAFALLRSLLMDGNEVDFRLVSSTLARDPNAAIYLDALIGEFAVLSKSYPREQSLQLALVQLYQMNGKTAQALKLVERLADDLHDAPEVVMLEAELLEQNGDSARAQRRMAQSLRSHPEHKDLRLRYARKLLEAHDYKKAKEQFAELAARNPDDSDTLYSLALLSLDEKLYNEAKDYLQRLVQNRQRLDDAHYYLGFIANEANHPDEAIEHYQQVRRGANFMAAQRSLTELMVSAGRYAEITAYLQNLRLRNNELNLPLLTMEANVLLDQQQYTDAATLLDGAVGAFPNDIQLLFLRSVLNQERNDLPLMEQDLRRIIQLNPSNPVAYNSLGYILADRTMRYEEAYELIQKAIELAPDDPAIIDSLGWVQYRLGHLDQARSNLDRAYQLFPDPEVAAHLGEVMWMQGDKNAASRLWRKVLSSEPDSPQILETAQRLGAKL